VEGGVEHHGKGVKLLWGSGDNGAHRATLFTAAVTQQGTGSDSADSESGRPVVRSRSRAVLVGNSGRRR
jgi:hypothetical protein